MTNAILLAAWLAGAEPCVFTAEDERRVRAVVDAYRSTWLRGDADGVLGTFTDDAVLLPANGAAPVVGHDAMRAYWFPPDAPPVTITRLEVGVEGLEGDCRLAHSYGRDVVEWTMGGRAAGHAGTSLNVYRKLPDGSWRIARRMWGDVPARN